jgi:HD superfamily phosphodiesterase
MEAGNPQVTGGEVLVNLYNLNDSDEEGLYIDKAQISEVKNDRKTDFETKNLERLKEMQERRKLEQQLIEESRKKMQKKQEKLKNIILKEAADYKALKA